MVLAAMTAKAQEDVSFSHYWAMPSNYNPAAAALDGKLDVIGAYSSQLSGFENNPKTMYIGVDLPIYFISAAHSTGVSFLSDQTGLFKHMRVSAQYAYHHRFGKNFRVSGGIRFSLLSETFDGGKADVVDTGDPVVATSSVDGTAFDMDFGLRVDYKKLWYAGVSMLHLTSPTVTYGDEKIYQYVTSSTFYLTGGYNIKFRSPLFIMQLDAIVRSNLTLWRGDLTARVRYNGASSDTNHRFKYNLYLGLGYSPTNSVSFLLGGEFRGATIGYSYEWYTKGVGMAHGTHEITLGYQIDLDLFKKGRNLHKSVRHL